MAESEKSISLRLPGKLVELLKFLAGDEKKMSGITRDRLDVGLKIADGRLALMRVAWGLQENEHQSMSAILEKLYDNPDHISQAEVIFMCGLIQDLCNGGMDMSVGRYIDLLQLVLDLYLHMTNQNLKVDEHYVASKLRTTGDSSSSVIEMLEHYKSYAGKHQRSLDVDDMTKALKCLVYDSWQFEEHIFRKIVAKRLDTLVTLASKSVFIETPYVIPESRSLSIHPFSARRSHKDFKISVYDIQGFSCVIEMPFALITTDYRGFYKLLHMKGLLSAPNIPSVYLPFIDNVRLYFPADEVMSIRSLCCEIAAEPEFVERNKLLALAHGVAD